MSGELAGSAARWTLRDSLDEKQACEQIITNATNRQATSGTLH